MHIIESGTVALDIVSTVSSIIAGTGIFSTRIIVAISVATRGAFIAFLSLNFSPSLPSRKSITPAEYSSRLNGIFDSEAKNTAPSPYIAATIGNPIKPLFINATSIRYIPLSPSLILSTPGLIHAIAKQISIISASIKNPVSASAPVSSISLLITEDKIMPTRKKFITSLLNPLLNSGPTSFSLAHK